VSVQLVPETSDLCDPDPPTLQTDRRTDRQTDRQTTCDRNTALCTKVHRAVKIETSESKRAGTKPSLTWSSHPSQGHSYRSFIFAVNYRHKPAIRYAYRHNNAGLISKVSEEVGLATEIAENCRRRQPTAL